MSSRTAEEMDRAVGPRDASRGPWLDTAPPVDVHAYIPASRRPVALRGNLLRIFISTDFTRPSCRKSARHSSSPAIALSWAALLHRRPGSPIIYPTSSSLLSFGLKTIGKTGPDAQESYRRSAERRSLNIRKIDG